jgi:hypothetical protein
MTDMAFWIALAGAVLGAASMVLHVVATKVKKPWVAKVEEDIDWLKSKMPGN